MGLESNFAKLVGAFVMSFAVFAAFLRLFGPWLHRTLQARSGPQPRRRVGRAF
jgi:hypothetical protein